MCDVWPSRVTDRNPAWGLYTHDRACFTRTSNHKGITVKLLERKSYRSVAGGGGGGGGHPPPQRFRDYRLTPSPSLISVSGERSPPTQSQGRRSCPLLASAGKDHLSERGHALSWRSAAGAEEPVLHHPAPRDHRDRGSNRIRYEWRSLPPRPAAPSLYVCVSYRTRAHILFFCTPPLQGSPLWASLCSDSWSWQSALSSSTGSILHRLDWMTCGASWPSFLRSLCSSSAPSGDPVQLIITLFFFLNKNCNQVVALAWKKNICD